MKTQRMCLLTALGLVTVAIVGTLLNSSPVAAQPPGQGGPSITIAGPLPVPVAGTVQVAPATLFRGQLENDGVTVTGITNNQTKPLVIDFVNALGGVDTFGGPATLILAVGPEQHLYFFFGPVNLWVSNCPFWR